MQSNYTMNKFTGQETLQFDYRVTPEVRDVFDMGEGKEEMKKAKAEFIYKVQREKLILEVVKT